MSRYTDLDPITEIGTDDLLGELSRRARSGRQNAIDYSEDRAPWDAYLDAVERVQAAVEVLEDEPA